VEVFTPSGLAPIALNIVTIACAWLLAPYTPNPARALAVGIFIGGVLEAAIQLPSVLKRGFRFGFTGLRRACRDPGVRTVLRLIGPTIVGMAAYQLNDLVSTALAGRSGEGVVSSLQYSLRLQELILGVFAVSIGTVLLPNLSEYAKSGQRDLFNKNLMRASLLIAFITIPVTFYSLIMGEDMIRLLYQTRAFSEESVRLTLAAFRLHICGLFFIALNRILAPAFYAQSDSKRPTLAGIISFAVNMALAFALAPRWKGAGIAFALSAASLVNTAVLLGFLRGGFRLRRTPLLAFVGIIILSIAASFVAYQALPYLRAACAGMPRLLLYGVPLVVNALIFGAFGAIGLLIWRFAHE
jgi:putative peptidoglycan lipid II flippase